MSVEDKLSAFLSKSTDWERRQTNVSSIFLLKLPTQRFVQVVNSGINFNNKKGIVDAIPVIAYHIVDNSLNPSSTDVNLFAAEMKYLHDNHFDVIPMSDLGYDQNTNHIYIR